MDRNARRALNEGLTRLADGDRSAFHPVFTALWPVLRSFARRFLCHDSDGDDAAQEALLKVFARAGEFDPGRDALTWALAIAANECRTTRNRVRRRRESAGAELGTLADGGASPEAAAMEAELGRALAEALGALRPEDLATIQAALGGERPAVPPATFRKRLQRALERLRDAWGIDHGAP